MFTFEFCKFFKNTSFYRTPLVAASKIDKKTSTKLKHFEAWKFKN